MTRDSVRLIAMAGLVLSALVLSGANPAAAGGGKGDKGEKSGLEADLVPCCGEQEPGAEGRAVRLTLAHEGVAVRDRFRMRIDVPVPSAALGISDEETARAADIRVVLYGQSGAYAECTLGFLELEAEEEEGGARAKYGVEVVQVLRHGVPVLRMRKGTCDVDLTADGVQAGLPAVQVNDTAVVLMVGPPDVSFLQGTFAVKQLHREK